MSFSRWQKLIAPRTGNAVVLVLDRLMTAWLTG